jgi:hypothetical protein
MSADAYRVCPKCYATSFVRRAAAMAKVSESYGKVKAELYGKMIADANRDYPLPTNDETLREDYEIGIRDGDRFVVDFAASCSDCGFRFSFKHEEQVIK